MRRNLVTLVALTASGFVASADAAYVLTNAPNTTVKYEVKQASTNVNTANSIVSSLGTTSTPTYGVLTDGTLVTLVGSGVAFDNELNDNGLDGNYDYLTQGGSTTKSAIDLTFVAAAGQKFTAGDLRVNTTILDAGLWDDTDYVAWQISTDGGASFTDIYRRTMLDARNQASSRWDSGVQSIPGINGATSIIVRGLADSSQGVNNAYSTRGHWHLLDTAPWTTGSFAGGLEVNLTTAPLPEPAALGLLGVLAPAMLRRRRA